MATGGASLGTAEGRITVDAGQAISEIGRVGSMMDSLDAKATGAGQGVSDFHQSTIGLAQGMQHLGRVGVGLGAATAAPFIAGVKAAADFEQSMTNVNSVMDLQGDQFQQLSDLALQLGKDTVFTGEDAAAGMETLGKAGIDFTDILGGAADAATKLAAAGGTDVPRAAEVMASAMNAFNISGSESIKVADALAGVANQTQSDVNQLGIGLGQVAGVAHAANMGLDETVAFLGLMADNGIRGSDAATSMKNAIISLLSPTDKASGIMDTLGISLLDTEGNFVGLAGASQQFFDAWKRSGQTMSEFMDPLTDVLGRDAVRTILFGMQAMEAQLNGTEGAWSDYINAANDAGAANDFAAKRMDSTEGAIERLKGSLNALQVNMGQGINTAIRPLIEGAVGFVNALAEIPAPIMTAISAVGLLAGGLTTIGGAFLLVGGYVLEAVARFTAAGFALSGLVGPAVAAAGVLAGIGVAIAAYQGNWLGFADAVNSVTNALKGLVGIQDQTADTTKRERWDWHEKDAEAGTKEISGLEAVLVHFGNTLQHSTVPAIRDLGRWIALDLNSAVKKAQNTWQTLTSRGISPAVAALKSAEAFFDRLGAGGAADVFENLAQKATEFGISYASMIRDLAHQGVTGVTAQLEALSVALSNTFGPNGVSDLLNTAARATLAFGDAWQKATDLGFNPAGKALVGLAGIAAEFGHAELGQMLLDAASAAQRFGNAFEKGQLLATLDGANGLSAGIRGLAAAMETLGFEGVAAGLNTMATAIDAASRAYNEATASGLNPFQAALRGVDAALDTVLSPEQQANLDSLSAKFQGLAEQVGNFVGSGLDRAVQFFNELGTAIDAGNFQGILDAIGSLGTDIQSKLQELVANLQTIDIPSIVVHIGTWVIEQAQDLMTRIKDALGFGTGNAQAGLGGTGTSTILDIPALTARISGWVIEQATNLFDEIKTFLGFGGGEAQAGLGGTGSAGTVIDIPSITARIASWVVTAAQSLGDAIQQFFGFGVANSMGGPGERGEAGTASAGITLDGVAVNIASWVTGKLAGLEGVIGEVKTWIQGQLDGAGISIDNFNQWALSLGLPSTGDPNGGGSFRGGSGGVDWGAWINQQLTSAAIAVEGFTGWKLELGTPEINWANIGELVGAIDKPLDQIPTTGAFVESAKAKGEEIGTNIGTALAQGIRDAMDAAMSGGGGREGPLQASFGGAGLLDQLSSAPKINMAQAAGGFVNSFVEGFKAAIGPALAEAKAELIPWFQEQVRQTLMDVLNAPLPSLGGVDMSKQANPVGIAADFGGFLREKLFGANFDAAPPPADLANVQKIVNGQTTSYLDTATGAVVDATGNALTKQGLVIQYQGETYAQAAARLFLDGLTGRSGGGVLGGAVKAGEADAAALRIVSPLVDGMPEAMGQAITDNFQLVNQETGKAIQVGLDAWGNVVQTAPTSFLENASYELMSKADQALAQGTLAVPMDQTPKAVSGMLGGAVQEGIDTTKPTGLMAAAPAQEIGKALDTGMGVALEAVPMPKTGQAIGGLLGTAAQQGAEQMSTQGADAASGAAGQAAGGIGDALDAVMATQISGTTLDAFSQAIGSKIAESIGQGISAGDASPQAGLSAGAGGTMGIGNTIATSLATSITGADFAAVGTAIQTKISTAITTGMSAEGDAAASGTAGTGVSIGTTIANSLATAITGADFAAVGTAIQTKISQAVSTGMAAGTGGGGGQGALGTSAVTGSSIGSAIAQQIASQISGADFSAVGTSIAQQIGAALGQGTGDVEAALGAVLSAITAYGVQASNGAQWIGAAFVQYIGTGMGPGVGILQSAVDACIQAAVASGTATAGTAQTIGQALTTAVGQGIGAGTGTVTAAVGAMVSATISAGSSAAAGAQAIGTALTTAVGQGIGAGTGTITAAIEAAVAAAISAGQGAAAGASAIGVAIGQGIADGIASMSGVVEAAARAVVGAAVAAASAAADTGSPSKLFRDEIGVPIGQGVAVGMMESIPEVEAAGAKMVDGAAKATAEAGKSFKELRGLTDTLGKVPGAEAFADRIAAIGDRLREARKDIMSRTKDLTGGLTKTLHDGATKAGREAGSIGKSVSSGLSAASSAGASAGDAKDSKKSIVGDLKGMKSDVKELQTLIGVLDRTPGAEGLASRMSELAGSIESSRKTALDSARDIVTKVEGAVREAGSKLADAGTDMGTAISDGVSTGITSGTEEATSTAQSMIDQITGQLNANLDRLPEMADAMGTGIGEGVAGGLDSTVPAVQDSAAGVGQGVTDGLSSAQPQMESAGTNAVDGVTTAMDQAASAQGDFAQQIGAAISSLFGQGVAEGGSPQVGADMVTSFHDAISQAVQTLLPQTEQAGADVGAAFSSGIKTGDPTQEASSLVNQAGQGIQQGTPAVTDAAQQAGSSIGGAVDSGISDSCNAVNNSAAQLTDSCIPQGIESGTSTAEGIAKGAGQDISEKLVDGLDVKKKDVTKQFSGAGSGFGKGMASGIGSTVADNVKSAQEVTQHAGSVDGHGPGSSVGASFGQGMAAGIEKYIPAVIDAAVKAVKKAEDAAKNEGKSKSPSKVFMDIGRDLSLGMAIGMEQGYPDIENISKRIVGDTADVFGGAGLMNATKVFDKNMGRYTDSIENALRWIDRTVDTKNLPSDTTLSKRESARRAFMTPVTTDPNSGKTININGLSIPADSAAGQAAYDLVEALESMHGQYIGRG